MLRTRRVLLAGASLGLLPSVIAATAVRGLCRFAQTRGIPASLEFLLDYDVIEASQGLLCLGVCRA